jgi:hypothetical protein
METSSAIAGIVRVLNIDYHKAGLEKTQPSGFLGFLGFWVFWFFLYICLEERVLRVFSVSRILLGASRC